MQMDNQALRSLEWDQRVIIFLLSGLVLLLIYLICERYLLHRNRKKLLVRVHVNGTRGKSSTTRLVAAILRAKYRTVAKTTGTLPRRILEDGSEKPIIRTGSANISEQIKTLIWAGRRQAEAIVLECMALRPEYQSLCEREIIQASIAVITNIRADHLDVMGPGVEDVGWALAGMIPQNGILVTAEQNYRYLLEEACRHKNAKLVCIGSEEIHAISDQSMSQFQHLEHKDNVAIALKIANICGISSEEAWKTMITAQPDPGALVTFTIKQNKVGPLWYFVNAFAANDPDSSFAIWQQSLSSFVIKTHAVVLFNLREDRIDRTLQMADLALQLQEAKTILLMGNGTKLFLDRFLSKSSQGDKIIDLGDRSGAEVAHWLSANLVSHSLVVALGNIGGHGFSLVESLRQSAQSAAVESFYLDPNASEKNKTMERELIYD